MTRKPRKTWGKIALAILFTIGTWLLCTLWLMLAVGIAHRDWWPAVPVMSYHTALILGFFLELITAACTSTPPSPKRKEN
jgi:apolipoprotein N-acyltransferase